MTSEKHRNTEYLKLRGTHKDHLVKLLDPYRQGGMDGVGR